MMRQMSMGRFEHTLFTAECTGNVPGAYTQGKAESISPGCCEPELAFQTHSSSLSISVP